MCSFTFSDVHVKKRKKGNELNHIVVYEKFQ